MADINVIIVDTLNRTSQDLKILNKFVVGDGFDKPTFNTGLGGAKIAVPVFKLNSNTAVSFGFYLALCMLEVRKQNPNINICEVFLVKSDDDELSYGAIYYAK